MRSLFARTQIISLLLSFLLLGGVSLLETYESPVFSSVEVGIQEYSPAGAGGGALIPASCPSDLHDEPYYGQYCTIGYACGTTGGYLQCGGWCSAPNPNPGGYGSYCTIGYACGTTGGYIQCNGACSAPNPNPAGYGGSCQSSPNACGQTSSGTIACNGACNASAPANPPGYGGVCNGPANSCGSTNQGTTQCNGTCSAQFAPPNPPNYGNACTGPVNSCGLRNIGSITCGGSCSATTAPPEGLCNQVGNNPCLTLTANPEITGPNGFSTLAWSSTCGSTCTLYNMGSGAIIATSTSGSKLVGPHSAITEYALTCAAITDSVTVSPSNAGEGQFQEF